METKGAASMFVSSGGRHQFGKAGTDQLVWAQMDMVHIESSGQNQK